MIERVGIWVGAWGLGLGYLEGIERMPDEAHGDTSDGASSNVLGKPSHRPIIHSY